MNTSKSGRQDDNWKSTYIALEIAREHPDLPPGLIRPEVERAMDYLGTTTDREGIKAAVLQKLQRFAVAPFRPFSAGDKA